MPPTVERDLTPILVPQPHRRSELIDDEAICVDDEIASVSVDSEVTTRQGTSSPSSSVRSPPQPPSRSDRQDSLLSSGRVVCDDKPSNPSDVRTHLDRDEDVARNLHATLERRARPLPVVGGIRRNRRSRSRARPPSAEARRCPSPQHEKRASFWTNGRNPPANTPVYKCIDCRVWFTHPGPYHNHLGSHLHEFKVGSGSQVYWCGICRRTLLTSNDHRIHLESRNHWRRVRQLASHRTSVNIPNSVRQEISAVDGVPPEFFLQD